MNTANTFYWNGENISSVNPVRSFCNFIYNLNIFHFLTKLRDCDEISLKPLLHFFARWHSCSWVEAILLLLLRVCLKQKPWRKNYSVLSVIENERKIERAKIGGGIWGGGWERVGPLPCCVFLLVRPAFPLFDQLIAWSRVAKVWHK